MLIFVQFSNEPPCADTFSDEIMHMIFFLLDDNYGAIMSFNGLHFQFNIIYNL